jgi:hypothetical protein
MSSLSDALLLEPAPFEVWVALRTDGQKGSGRIDDPWDGSTVHASPVQITSIVRSGSDDRDALVTTSASHGYANDDYIRIAGATGVDAPLYNGTFVIFAVTSTTFKYRVQWPFGGNAAGSITAEEVLAYRFDDVMRSLAVPNVTVHIGPGVFETMGNHPLAPDNQRWSVRSGWKIRGSGMGATTLKLVGATKQPAMTRVISGPAAEQANDLDFSDFSLDCNLNGQPILEAQPWPVVNCGGIEAGGSRNRLRLVRAIHFGSFAPSECFVFSMAAAHPNYPEPVGCVIEDCVMEQPAGMSRE